MYQSNLFDYFFALKYLPNYIHFYHFLLIFHEIVITGRISEIIVI